MVDVADGADIQVGQVALKAIAHVPHCARERAHRQRAHHESVKSGSHPSKRHAMLCRAEPPSCPLPR